MSPDVSARQRKRLEDAGWSLVEFRSGKSLWRRPEGGRLYTLKSALKHANRQERAATEKVERAEKKVLQIRYPMSATDVDKETIRMSYRDAYGRADSAGFLEESPAAAQEELERLLQQADNSGDTQLADAVFHVATLKGIRKVADAYLESRPAQKEGWEEFVTAKREETALKEELGWARAFPLQKPAELGGMGNFPDSGSLAG